MEDILLIVFFILLSSLATLCCLVLCCRDDFLPQHWMQKVRIPLMNLFFRMNLKVSPFLKKNPLKNKDLHFQTVNRLLKPCTCALGERQNRKKPSWLHCFGHFVYNPPPTTWAESTLLRSVSLTNVERNSDKRIEELLDSEQGTAQPTAGGASWPTVGRAPQHTDMSERGPHPMVLIPYEWTPLSKKIQIAVIHVQDIMSSFELLIPDSNQNIYNNSFQVFLELCPQRLN